MSSERAAPMGAQYARWLAALFVAIELVTITSAVVFVLLPLARRASDDFVGLLIASAQTWSGLPSEARPAFERELAAGHQVALRPGTEPADDTGLRHGLYIYFVERAFERQLGRVTYLVEQSGPDGEPWLWATVRAGGKPVAVGFPHERVDTRPLVALALATLAGAVLAGTLARHLARRITEPVARLEQAAAQLAHGASPQLLPESGPRELADLARHFNRMALQLRELNDARTTLFAGISHDLRTPLARMRLALEMMSLAPDPGLLRRMEGDIERMNRLIAQMLDIARGLSTEPPQELALADWLRARARTHADAAHAVGATIAVSCDGALRAQAAPGMLERVLDNLIENALRYAPGEVTLVAHAAAESRRDGLAGRIGVLDRGPSIPPDQLEAVFRPFHRVEPSRSPALGGFGLGLAIVRQLARANGWQVRLERRSGGGLEAWIELDPAA